MIRAPAGAESPEQNEPTLIVLLRVDRPSWMSVNVTANEDNMNARSRCFTVILLLALWLLTACAPPGPTPTPTPEETNLPFETIEREDFGYNYLARPNEPQRVFLIRSTDEITRIPSGWISPDAEKALAQLDYQRYFALALFRDLSGSSGYDVIIQRVSRRNDKLVLHVQFWAPSPHYSETALATRPYHVIKVLRDGGALEETGLVLESQLLTPTPPSAIRRLTPGSAP